MGGLLNYHFSVLIAAYSTWRAPGSRRLVGSGLWRLDKDKPALFVQFCRF